MRYLAISPSGQEVEYDFEAAERFEMLQHQGSVTLSDVRDIFDELIAIYPGVSSHLAADPDVGKNTEFEAACVAVLRSGADKLMAKLRHLLEPFCRSHR